MSWERWIFTVCHFTACHLYRQAFCLLSDVAIRLHFPVFEVLDRDCLFQVLIHCFCVGVGWDERAPGGVWRAQTGVQRQGLPNLLLLWVSLSWCLTRMHKQSHLLKNWIKWTKLLRFKSDLILKPFWCYSVYLYQCCQVNYLCHKIGRKFNVT